MSLIIKKDGRVLCAAIHKKESGDLYIDDELHYHLSVVEKILVTEPIKQHKLRGEWWWRHKIPKNIKIEKFYKNLKN